MLHFFRKIRRDLLANSQFFRYLKYAIGEIILVVLGILIALYINNQNELRKEQERFDEVLAEVEAELIWNTKNSLMGISGLTTNDSLCYLIVTDGLTKDQLENDTFFQFRKPYLSFGFVVEDKAFKKLMTIDNGLTMEQDSIRRILTNLYNTDSIAYMEMLNNRSLDLEDEQMRSVKKHDWYIDYTLKEPYSEKEIEYYLQDPEYKKNAAEYLNITILVYHRYLIGWFQRFLNSYNKIYSYLETNNLQHDDSIHFTYDAIQYKHWVGSYKTVEWPSFADAYFREKELVSDIELLNDSYWVKVYQNDTLVGSDELFPLTRTCFIVKRYPNEGFRRFSINQNNKVSGFEFINGPFRIRTEKIR